MKGNFYKNKLSGCEAEIGTRELSSEQEKLACSNAGGQGNDQKSTISVLEKG